jgi:hypothetical protein
MTQQCATPQINAAETLSTVSEDRRLVLSIAEQSYWQFGWPQVQ